MNSIWRKSSTMSLLYISHNTYKAKASRICCTHALDLIGNSGAPDIQRFQKPPKRPSKYMSDKALRQFYTFLIPIKSIKEKLN